MKATTMIAVMLFLVGLSPAEATIFSADFDDGTNEGFVDPTPAGTPWAVLDKTGGTWTTGEDGALWQTDGSAGRFGGDDLAFNDDIVSGTFIYTALVHPVADGEPGEQATGRYGIYIRSGGHSVTKINLTLEELTGGRLLLATDNGALNLFDNVFNWSYGSDYTLQLDVDGNDIIGRVWNGDTTAGAPAAILSGTETLITGPDDDIGLNASGGTAYFDNVVVIPEPGVAMLLLAGSGLLLGRRRLNQDRPDQRFSA